jgi:hypothetical protein
MLRRRHAVDRNDVAEAEDLERRQVQRTMAADVAERVAALVAVRRGIGQLTDADAVEHDQEDAREDRHVDGAAG